MSNSPNSDIKVIPLPPKKLIRKNPGIASGADYYSFQQ